MIILSHNISRNLEVSLSEIEKSRKNLLAHPLSTKDETRYRWEGTLNKVYWNHAIEGIQITKREVAKLLSNPKKKLTVPESSALAYKRGLDYIRQYWYVNPRPITPSTVTTLYEIALQKSLGKKLPSFFVNEDAKLLLDYIQGSRDNPITQVGIVYFHVLTHPKLDAGNIRLASLMAYLVLYKNGLDMRGVLCFEEYFRGDIATFKRVIEHSFSSKTLTLWLEYFANCISLSLRKTLADVNAGRFKVEMPSVFMKINARQKEILTLLEIPDEKISNKMVQKMFGISQITASRDLSHLAHLGLITTTGRGRSTYYIKV